MCSLGTLNLQKTLWGMQASLDHVGLVCRGTRLCGTVLLIHHPDVDYWLLSMLPSVRALVERCRCTQVGTAVIVVRWRGLPPPLPPFDAVSYSLLALDRERGTQELYHPEGRNSWHTHALRTCADWWLPDFCRISSKGAERPKAAGPAAEGHYPPGRTLQPSLVAHRFGCYHLNRVAKAVAAAIR